MTLVATTPSANISQAIKFDNRPVSDDDNQSQASEDDVTALKTLCTSNSVVQSLGLPDSDELPQFGNVCIENSTDVHFGDKNIYQGPVTIKQIVYANGTPLAITSGDNYRSGLKDNPAFECDSDFKKDGGVSSVIDSEKGKNYDGPGGDASGELGNVVDRDISFPRKGYIWLQNIPRRRPLEIGIFLTIVVLSVFVLMVVIFLNHSHGPGKASIIDSNEQDDIRPVDYDPDISTTSQIINKLRIVSRLQWVAQPPINQSTPLKTPVPLVIIHHTATENCSSQSQCVFHVRYIQTFHIESKGFWDIGYNFLVGGDGAAYEGRGWQGEGAHTYGYNSRSIGIAFIGTFLNSKPPEIQIIACKKLIEMGVELGYIAKNYKLLAVRQLQGTESPGLALFEDMKAWPHWTEEP